MTGRENEAVLNLVLEAASEFNPIEVRWYANKYYNTIKSKSKRDAKLGAEEASRADRRRVRIHDKKEKILDLARKNHNRICKSLRANQPKPQLKDILDILKIEEMLRVEETDREDDGAGSDSDEDGDDTSASEQKFVKVKQPRFLNNYPSIKTYMNWLETQCRVGVRSTITSSTEVDVDIPDELTSLLARFFQVALHQ